MRESVGATHAGQPRGQSQERAGEWVRRKMEETRIVRIRPVSSLPWGPHPEPDI